MARALLAGMQQNPYQAPYHAPQGYPQGPQGYGGGYQQPMQSAGYEFTPQQNAVIGSTAVWTRGAGIIQAVLGGLIALGALGAIFSGNVGGGIGNGVAAAVYLTIGFAFISAAGALGRVVGTQGNDIQHLMSALEAYQRAFKIQVILVLVAIALVIIGAIIVFGFMR